MLSPKPIVNVPKNILFPDGVGMNIFMGNCMGCQDWQKRTKKKRNIHTPLLLPCWFKSWFFLPRNTKYYLETTKSIKLDRLWVSDVIGPKILRKSEKIILAVTLTSE